ncbi:hypothetical protein ACLOJK_030676 [Asimina triloba]
MYSNQYDGNSLFSGGGFMPSQATQSTDSGFSPAKNRSNQCLLPLTVKQISDAFQSSDDKSNFIIDGVEVNNITLVGMVMNKVEKVTDVNFTLDDGTGRIDIHRWVNDAAESNEMAAIMNGMYVRVNGQLKGFQGKKQAVAFSVSITQLCAKEMMFSTHAGMAEAGTDFDQMVLAIFHEPENLAKESGVHVDKIVERLGVSKSKVIQQSTVDKQRCQIAALVEVVIVLVTTAPVSTAIF